MVRPRIALLGRFTENASALRYRGVVSSRALLDVVWAAGGDPVTLLPGEGPEARDWTARLAGFSGVLLPGGGDIDPGRYGGDRSSESLYDIDETQDEADFSLAAYALAEGVPLLAVCRGMHVLNVSLGGTLVVDMAEHHRHRIQQVVLDESAARIGLSGSAVEISCYHHQAIDDLGRGVNVIARAMDSTVEAITVEAQAWTAGVQWHPEDTWAADGQQVDLVRRFVVECAAATN